ncbi:MAG: TonB-dependent receptor [Candidatus Delongbacteria bacterium]|nr:TonB-dependent receptor [Candidatus Delongbacteria bacterium]MCG2761414.1 TonB-dependent receptor [Candidatus Delongbacteria bacterium]
MKRSFVKYIPAQLGRIFRLRILVILIIFTAELFSGSVISGIIRDENSKPVPDVNIKLYPSVFGTISDENGEFNFSRIAEGKYRLVFEHISYQSKEIEIISKVEDAVNLSVILKTAVVNLEPIVAENAYETNSRIIINSRAITQSGSKNAEEILISVSDINIENTDGSKSRVSIRGTDSKHTSVYLDGVLLNSSMDGSFDLRSIPSEMIETIEIFTSGDLILSGRSVGGIISIKTKKTVLQNETAVAYSNSFYMSDRDEFSAGRMNNHDYDTSVKYSFGKNSGMFLTYSGSRNGNEWSYINAAKTDEYRYINHQNIPRIQTNDYVYSDNIFASLNYSADQINFSLGANYSESKIGMPGWYDQPYYSAYAKKRNLAVNGSAEFVKVKRYSVNLESSYNLKNDKTKIEEINELFFVDSDDEFENIKFKLSLKYSFMNFDLRSGGEYFTESVKSNSLDLSERSRDIKSIYSKLEYNDNIFIDDLSIHISGAVRKDFISGTDFEKPLFSLDNSLEYNKGIFTIIPKYSYSQSYNLPSFSALFWADNLFSTGNQDLKPEYSVQHEVSLSNSFNFNDLKIRLNYSWYDKSLDDLIVWIKRTNGKYSPENFKEGKINGHEISVGADTFNDKLKLDISYSLMSVKQFTDNIVTDDKYTIYKPVETLLISMVSGMWDIHTSFRAKYNGKMYLNETNSIDIYPFWLFGATVSKEFKVYDSEIRLFIGGENLLDEQYQVIYGYPMQGRKIESGINIKF